MYDRTNEGPRELPATPPLYPGAFAALALSLVAALTVVGCSAPTPCDDALDKVRSCGLTNATLTESGDQCMTYAACAAECVKKAGCNDIQANAKGDTNNALGACIDACGE
jgi:hypothetical protein